MLHLYQTFKAVWVAMLLTPWIYMSPEMHVIHNAIFAMHPNAIFSLLLPGKVLHLNALLLMRKFRDRGNKAGAVRGFETLEKHGLGHLISTRLQRGANMVHISKENESNTYVHFL